MNSTKDNLPAPAAVIPVLTMRRMVLNSLYAIPAGGLIGWLLGSWLDRAFHTGWITVTGIIACAVAGFMQIVTLAARYLKDNR